MVKAYQIIITQNSRRYNFHGLPRIAVWTSYRNAYRNRKFLPADTATATRGLRMSMIWTVLKSSNISILEYIHIMHIEMKKFWCMARNMRYCWELKPQTLVEFGVWKGNLILRVVQGPWGCLEGKSLEQRYQINSMFLCRGLKWPSIVWAAHFCISIMKRHHSSKPKKIWTSSRESIAKKFSFD